MEAFLHIPKQTPVLPFGEFNANCEILRARIQIAQGRFSVARETLRHAEALTAEQGMRSMNLLVRLRMGNLGTTPPLVALLCESRKNA